MQPITKKLRAGIYPSTVRLAHTKSLAPRQSKLYEIPEHIPTGTLKDVFDLSHIKKVFADAASHAVLKDPAIAGILIENMYKPLSTNLFFSLKSTGVKLLFDEKQGFIFFIKDPQNLRVFRNIGFSAAEFVNERRGASCPSQKLIHRFVTMEGLLDSEDKMITSHLLKCPSCADIYNMILTGDYSRAKLDLEE